MWIIYRCRKIVLWQEKASKNVLIYLWRKGKLVWILPLLGFKSLLMKETQVTTYIHQWSLSLPPTCSVDSSTMCHFLLFFIPHPSVAHVSQLWFMHCLNLKRPDLDLWDHAALCPCLVWGKPFRHLMRRHCWETATDSLTSLVFFFFFPKVESSFKKA